jgi:hypothetical protein
MTQSTADLIRRDRSANDAQCFHAFEWTDDSRNAFAATGKDALRIVAPSFGQCAMISAVWAVLLRDQNKLPAVAVAGDLILKGKSVFTCDRNVPTSTESAGEQWDGHCWVELGDAVGDASLFRTAARVTTPSRLKGFVERTFPGRTTGALAIGRDEALAQYGLDYVPKFVLTEAQLAGLCRAVDFQSRKSSI